MNEYHEANRARWEAGAATWAHYAERRGIWRECARKPELALAAEEIRALGDVKCLQVCVLGSGDNQVVFALAGMGAKVTSVDISEKQLAGARERAGILGLDVRFVRADVTELSAIGDAAFDVVFTGGHVAVWVSDVRRFYAEAARILKAGGRFIVSEYHPFRRLWKDSKTSLEIERTYFARGPHRFENTVDILYPAAGDVVSYEFNWTVADYISAVMDSGCVIERVEEFGEASEGWEAANLAGLPARLMIVARKR
jgi:ubiquinone/menaquinone biosynthesis C-methylase UbiE